ncbi:serine hydrolase domain-containing protein [Fulvivirga lutimaris]|uniref:serine hydrolase domain-containing protein n=1 Tax=Fulvivirga lutimaris TaxID=1819566 RepID=UPI0012BD72FE|nr:serine hydrolase domain-containing protein [Fulvivirga lutimaris]MTI40485.1 class A beta-lactamase-related serine hydrolase [Fulvivirga lutimaris]
MSKVFKTFIMVLLTLSAVMDMNAQSLKKLDKYFKRKMNKANIAGMQMALIKEGQTQWIGSYGYRDFESSLPVNDNTLFMIASCSKPVTALGVLRLYEDGLLDLDQDINAYLPFKIFNPNYPNTLVTCRMLMTHMSSFKDNTETMNALYTMEKGGDSPESLESFVKNYFVEGGKYYNQETNFMNAIPTTEKSYCNAGYALLGYIIEVISGKSFNEFIAEKIFEPLDMTSSYWFLSQIKDDNISKPHEYVENDSKTAHYKTLNHYGYPDYPDGQLRTNVADYAQFINLILNKGKHNGIQLFKEETITEFLKVQYPETNEYQALAWNYNEFDNWIYYLLMARLPSHTGVDPGVATVVSFDPEKKMGAIIFSNTLTTSFIGHKIFYQEMMKKLLKTAERNKIN